MTSWKDKKKNTKPLQAALNAVKTLAPQDELKTVRCHCELADEVIEVTRDTCCELCQEFNTPKDRLREEIPLNVPKEVPVLTSPAFLKEMHTEFFSILPENITFFPNDTASDDKAGKCWDISLLKEDTELTSELAKKCASLFAAKLVALSDETGKNNFVSRLFIGNCHYRDRNVVFSYTLSAGGLDSANEPNYQKLLHQLNFLVEPVK